MLATIIVGLVAFFKAKTAGKVLGTIGGGAGLIIGSSAGIAHAGGASSASLLFGGIGLLLGSLTPLILFSGDGGAETPSNSNEQHGTPEPPPPSRQNDSKRQSSRPSRDTSYRNSSESTTAQKNPTTNATGAIKRETPQAYHAIADQAETGINSRNNALRTNRHFKGNPTHYLVLATDALVRGLERVSEATNLPEFEAPDSSDRLFVELLRSCLSMSLPSLELESIEKSATKISLVYGILASGLFVDGEKQGKLNDRLRASIAKINAEISSDQTNISTEIAHLCVVHGRVPAESIEEICWLNNMLKPK